MTVPDGPVDSGHRPPARRARGSLLWILVEEALRELVSTRAIHDVLYRYCRSLDRMDRPMAESVWHPGATADYGTMYEGTGSGFLEWVWEAHSALEAHSHQITNVLVDVDVDGDRAVSESYVTVALWRRLPDGGVVEIVGRGRYVDRWSCRDGRWAIDHRQFLSDMQHAVTLSAAQAQGGGDGRRDRSDPSYTALP